MQALAEEQIRQGGNLASRIGHRTTDNKGNAEEQQDRPEERFVDKKDASEGRQTKQHP